MTEMISPTPENSIEALVSLEQASEAFGFYWPDIDSLLAQAKSECDEIKESIELKESRERVREEIGDLLHTAICLCHFEGFEIRETLVNSAYKYRERFELLKKITQEKGLTDLKAQPVALKLAIWEEAKKRLKEKKAEGVV